MNRDVIQPYDLRAIRHIAGVDHNESLSVGPRGEAYTTGFYTQRVFRLNLEMNCVQVVPPRPFFSTTRFPSTSF